jgi:hypothetical protein
MLIAAAEARLPNRNDRHDLTAVFGNGADAVRQRRLAVLDGNAIGACSGQCVPSAV